MRPAKNDKCERCGRETNQIEYCDYCEPKRKICKGCRKSEHTHSKTYHTIICRDCWGSISKRTRFKSA